MKLYIIILALVVPLLAQDPEDLDSSYDALKTAVEKKDAAAVKKLSALTSEFARKIIAAPDADKDRVQHAKEIDKLIANSPLKKYMTTSWKTLAGNYDYIDPASFQSSYEAYSKKKNVNKDPT